MPKPVPPQIGSLQSSNVEQIERIEAEIDSLRVLEERKAISKADKDYQVNQRRRAQLLLFQKALGRTSSVINTEEKRVLTEQMTQAIKSMGDKKTELQKEIAAATAASKLDEAARYQGELTRVDANLVILNKADAMLKKMSA